MCGVLSVAKTMILYMQHIFFENIIIKMCDAILNIWTRHNH